MILLVVAIVILDKIMHVKVHTSHFTIGGEPAERWTERKIIQEQSDFAHEYLMGHRSLTGKAKNRPWPNMLFLCHDVIRTISLPGRMSPCGLR